MKLADLFSKKRDGKPEDAASALRHVVDPSPPTYRPAHVKVDADESGVTELRVHGVGGTAPDAMLGEPNPRLVAGDQIAGFYRGPDKDGRHIEAYSWGGLTSKSASRAWWILLLPFALGNLVGWMYSSRAKGTLAPRLIRAFCLSLTATYVLWVTYLSTDLVGFQCGGQPRCVRGRWWLAPFKNEWLLNYPGHRIAFTALVPLGLIALVMYAGRKSRRRYEEHSTKMEGLDDSRQGLEDPSFWCTAAFVRRLGWLHGATALSTLAFLMLLGLDTLSRLSGASETVITFGIWAVAADLALLLILTISVGQPKSGEHMKDSFPWKFKLTIGLSIGLLVFAFVTALTTGATREVPPSNFTSLLGIRGGIILIFLAQQMLAAVLIVMTLINRRRLDSTPQYWLGPASAAILAILILEASFAGGAIRFADLLGAAVAGSADSVSGGGQAPIIYQVNNVWFAVGFFLGSLVLLAFVAAFAVRIWLRRVKPSIDAINKEYDEIEGSDHDPPDDRPGQFSAEKKAWLQRVAVWRGMSQLADQSSAMLTFLLILCSLLGVAGIVVRFVYDDLWNRPPNWIHWLIPLSTLLLGLVPLGLIIAMRRAEKNTDYRRKVAILWDVLTVWPRHYHPFAPPCYAERAIPDLQRRILRLTENGRVILSAHSQGAVLAVATMLQLPEDRRCKVVMVTYGSPVTRLYRKFFPRWFGNQLVSRLGKSLVSEGSPNNGPRWQNFWRLTDPIGGPTFLDPDSDDHTPPRFEDVALIDPFSRSREPGEPRPPVAGHSHYLEDPIMTTRLDSITALLKDELEKDASEPNGTGPVQLDEPVPNRTFK